MRVISANERLRKRIRGVLFRASRGRKLAAAAEQELENRVLTLFQEYKDTPSHRRDDVYAKGERAILQRLRGQESKQVSHSR